MKQFQLSSERTITIANNLNMKINNREITVLLGHNGAGKTTIINMIMGIFYNHFQSALSYILWYQLSNVFMTI